MHITLKLEKRFFFGFIYYFTSQKPSGWPWDDPSLQVTHWGRAAAGCGTPLWVCRRPAWIPLIPAPGSEGWTSSPAPSPWAWRSGSAAGSPPAERANHQGGGASADARRSDKGWGCARIPGMNSTPDMLEHICHTLAFFLLSFLPYSHPLIPFVYSSCVGPSLLENLPCKRLALHLHRTHWTFEQRVWRIPKAFQPPKY